MERSKRINSPGILLTELIFAVLIFAVAAAVCMQLFAGAHSMSTRSVELSHAVSECSSAAELVSSLNSADELEKLIYAVYPTAEKAGESYTVFFSADFLPCPKTEARYTLSLNASGEEGGVNADIVFSSADEDIYTLSVFRHIRRRAE